MTGPVTPTDADRELADFILGRSVSEVDMGRIIAFRLAAEERGARMELEAAAKVAEAYDGKPCGPAQLWTDEQREFFDCGQLDASRSITTAIRQTDPAQIVKGQSDE
jgi:hypothetical protein